MGVFSACNEEVLFEESEDKQATSELKNTCGDVITTDLIAGQHTKVGTITSSYDGSNLIITYEITEDGWAIKETHLAVEENFSDIPTNNKGNPKIGNFEYSDEFSTPQTKVSYTVNVDGLNSVYIAAHAVVGGLNGYECETVADIELTLPNSLVNIVFQYNKTTSYYNVTLSNAGIYDGIFEAWCIDNNGSPVDYNQAMLVSSYDTAYNLSNIGINPDNLDLLNYLMNYYVETKPFVVIQAVIWKLMNGSYTNGTGGIQLTEAQLADVEAVYAEVLANGEGFVPTCGQKVVIIIDSKDHDRYQNTFILVPLKEIPFYGEETAWGNGMPFGGGNWAMYLYHCF